jgi:antimicrobial peptide system SdpA family protein
VIDRAARSIVATMTTIIVATIGLSSLPASTHASGPVADVVEIVHEVVPQGWGFFTRDPRSAFVSAFVKSSDGVWQNATRGPNATLKNAFGFNRASRLDEYDVSQVTGSREIGDLWQDCTGATIRSCADAARSEHGVQHWQAQGYDLRLCGDVLLLRTEPVPIAFAGMEFSPKTESIRASVTCVRERGR